MWILHPVLRSCHGAFACCQAKQEAAYMMKGIHRESYFQTSNCFRPLGSTCFLPVDAFEFSMNNLDINGKFNCMPLNLILI